jgi:hypothetical protein
MAYQLVDTYSGKVLSTYPKKAEAEKALGRLYNEPGEQRYEIKSPKKAKVTKDVQKESD